MPCKARVGLVDPEMNKGAPNRVLQEDLDPGQAYVESRENADARRRWPRAPEEQWVGLRRNDDQSAGSGRVHDEMPIGLWREHRPGIQARAPERFRLGSAHESDPSGGSVRKTWRRLVCGRTISARARGQSLFETADNSRVEAEQSKRKA